MAVVGERPQILNANFNEPGFARSAHDAVIQRPAKKVRKNRQYLELHSGLPNMGMVTSGAKAPLTVSTRYAGLKAGSTLHRHRTSDLSAAALAANPGGASLVRFRLLALLLAVAQRRLQLQQPFRQLHLNAPLPEVDRLHKLFRVRQQKLRLATLPAAPNQQQRSLTRPKLH